VTDSDAIDAARRALGHQLAAYRKAVGDSQAALAARVGYSRSAIANIETGRQRMSLDFWRRCDAALGASGQLIAGAEDIEEQLRRRRQHLAAQVQAERDAKIRELQENPMTLMELSSTTASAPPAAPTTTFWGHTLEGRPLPDGAWEDDVHRRALLQLLAACGAGAAIPADALENLRSGLASTIGPSEDNGLDEWERIAWEYGRAVVGQPPEPFIADLAVDIAEIQQLLRRTKAPLVRAGLMRVSAQLSALMANELHGLGMFGPAWRWWRTARGAADQSGDRDMRVWVRGRETLNSLHSPRSAASVLALASEAVRIAAGSSSAGLAEVHKNRAIALTRLGDESGARAALGDMRQVYERLPDRATSDKETLWGWLEMGLYVADSYVYTSFAAQEAASVQEKALSLRPAHWNPLVTQLQLLQSITLIQNRDISGGIARATASLESLPHDSRRRRPQILRLVRQIHNELPDDRTRALPEARDLQAFVNSAA
jgi:transcriptional regulator with XRE-family HTH domain